MRENVIYGEANSKLKCCADCGHLKAALAWWCTSKAASKYRGTNFPGVKHCKFWIPAIDYDKQSWWWRLKYRMDPLNLDPGTPCEDEDETT